MTASTKLALGLTLALLALGSLYGATERERGRQEARAEGALALADSLRARGVRTESVYVHVRDTLYRRLARVDTLTHTVEVWKHDTVAVVEYVTRTDSALKACSAVLTTCEEGWAVARSEALALRRALDAQPKPQSTLVRWGGRLVWLTAGVGLGKLAP